ncbi:uncharacterized protein LOC109792674 [Cajanus cajan]|uniref:uncharacterized protein LOC109792674 n=1 Tax=Cajanus cajan TaxID=3821 RepID=UPI00098D910A|nr:uncharacterized protein LOC109792674 [Cajanus cajan]
MRKPTDTARGGSQSRVATLRCYICGGPHFVQDFHHTRSRCFKCGQMGHELTNCLARARQTRSALRGDRPTTARRVFTLTGAEASTSSDLMKGKGKTISKDVMILFDSRASHSFISYACAKMLGVSVCDLGLRLLVLMPAFASVVAFEMCVGCPLEMGERKYKVEDVLLILASQDEMLMRDGAECCILLVAMSVGTEKVIVDLEVVKDFSEVFPNKVPGLPPTREIEFRKANVVANALSRKSIHMSALMVKKLELVEEFKALNLCVELLGTEKADGFELGGDGILRFKGRICLPRDSKFKIAILEEGQKSRPQDDFLVVWFMEDLSENEGEIHGVLEVQKPQL